MSRRRSTRRASGSDALAGSGLRVVVITPAHQFPTGVVTSPARRHALVRWARATGGLVVEDDYDAEFRYDRTPALQGLGPDVVGLRRQHLQDPRPRPAVRPGGAARTPRRGVHGRQVRHGPDLGTGVLEQATLADFLVCGAMDHHIRQLSMRYRTRRDHLVRALSTHLPDWTVTGTSAGLHLLAHALQAYDEVALAALAQRCGLDARPLGHYAIRPPDRPGLIIGYGHQRPDRLAEAVATLARTLSRGAASGTRASPATTS